MFGDMNTGTIRPIENRQENAPTARWSKQVICAAEKSQIACYHLQEVTNSSLPCDLLAPQDFERNLEADQEHALSAHATHPFVG